MDASFSETRSLVSFGRSARREFIVAKYLEHKYARRRPHGPEMLQHAIHHQDFNALLETFANGQDFGQPLPESEGQVRTISQGHM